MISDVGHLAIASFMNATLGNILATHTVADDAGQSYPVQSGVTAREGAQLQSLVLAVRPETSIEIGFAYGISTLFLCDALTQVEARRHIVCDPKQQAVWHNIGLKNVRDAGYGNLVDFRQLPSHSLLPSLLECGTRVQFAFVDGWHTFDYAFTEFFYIDHLLDVGGVVAFDDASWPAVRKVIRYVVKHRRYRVISCGPAGWVTQLKKLGAGMRRTGGVWDSLMDFRLGLSGDLIALRKEGEDILGDGTDGSRRWDQHANF